MIRAITPDWVETAEAFHDPPEVPLFPDEELVISNAVLKRRREFATARMCARRAMERLGVPPGPIAKGTRGEPLWPSGAVGSLTHCDGYRAAAVASDRTGITIGVDAEPNEALPDGVTDVVASAAERARLTRLAADRPQVCWDRLLFSAKESAYKAWFPLTRRWLDFDDASVTIEPDEGVFTVELLVDSTVTIGGERLERFVGRWSAADGLVATAIAVAAVTPHR